MGRGKRGWMIEEVKEFGDSGKGDTAPPNSASGAQPSSTPELFHCHIVVLHSRMGVRLQEEGSNSNRNIDMCG